MKDINGRGMARSYRAGQQHIRKLNEDRQRMAFIQRLIKAGIAAMFAFSDDEHDFMDRMDEEYGCEAVPDIFPGDANIIDSLRRKYGRRLEAGA